MSRIQMLFRAVQAVSAARPTMAEGWWWQDGRRFGAPPAVLFSFGPLMGYQPPPTTTEIRQDTGPSTARSAD